MATETSSNCVVFFGSSPEDIQRAKEFWKSIYPLPKSKSSLTVTGIDQRMHRASDPPILVPNLAHLTKEELEDQENDPNLQRNVKDAEKIMKEDREKHIQKIMEMKKEASEILLKRKQERQKKEEISRGRLVTDSKMFEEFNIDKSYDDEEESRNAMADLDKFDKKLEQKKHDQKYGQG